MALFCEVNINIFMAIGQKYILTFSKLYAVIYAW